MKKSKFSEEQIAFALRMAETGTRVAEVCRKLGIAEQTFYCWKRKYGGLGVSELRRLKQLEEENRRLKRMVADLSLDKQMLQDVQKNSKASPEAKASGSYERSVLGERAAGMRGHQDLAIVPPVLFPEERRPSPAAADP